MAKIRIIPCVECGKTVSTTEDKPLCGECRIRKRKIEQATSDREDREMQDATEKIAVLFLMVVSIGSLFVLEAISEGLGYLLAFGVIPFCLYLAAMVAWDWQ